MLIFDVAIVQTLKPLDKASYGLSLDTKKVRWPMSALGQKSRYVRRKKRFPLYPE
jgi:hypothetical protein